MRKSGHPRDRRSSSGYAMAGLLVAIGIMGILMSMAMPSWRTVTKREKEAELLFRGEQYIRAIDLYQRRFPGSYPTDLDLLVEQRFLRRHYPDPMTGEPFQILTQGSAAAALGETIPGAGTADDRRENQRSDRTGRTGFGSTGRGLGGRAGSTSPSPFSPASGGLGDDLGGIVGVVSRSSEESLPGPEPPMIGGRTSARTAPGEPGSARPAAASGVQVRSRRPPAGSATTWAGRGGQPILRH